MTWNVDLSTFKHV